MTTIIFLSLSLVFAVIAGILKGKTSEKFGLLVKSVRITTAICGIITIISLIILMGPDKSSGGTEMTSAMNKLTGGWSSGIILGFLIMGIFNLILEGVYSLAKHLSTSKQQREAEKEAKRLKEEMLNRFKNYRGFNDFNNFQ